MLALKLILAPLAVWLASVASKRYGHVIGGILSGFPMIAAPVTAALLFDHPATQVTAIAYATVSGLVATMAFIISFAWVAKVNQPWHVCLGAATTAFVATAIVLQAFQFPVELAVGLGIIAPWFARFTLPRLSPPSKLPFIPKFELVFRVIGAFVLAALLLLSAGNVPAWLSGLLIAWPITGSILPCFTQRFSGPNATVAFFSGFSRGLVGLATFFCVLGLLLPYLHQAIAYFWALLSAAIIAVTLAKTSQT